MGAFTYIETDTGTNVDISAATAVGAYTSTGDKLIMVDVSIDAVAGNGDYVMYVTRQIGGTGSAYVILPKTTMTAASGKTAISGQSGWITVRNGDVLTCYVDGLAGDTSTPDWTTRWFELAAVAAPDNTGIAAIQAKTDQLTFTTPNKVDASADVVLSPEAIEGMATAIRDGLPEDIWSSSIRTLTQSPAEIVATVLGADITQIRGDSWAVQLTGVELESIQQLAIKHSAKQSDSAALLFVDSVNGLTVLNGVAQDGEDSSKASLTYDGTILTLTVDASITAQLPVGSLQYGIQSISSNGIVSEPYGGTFRVLADIVRATD